MLVRSKEEPGKFDDVKVSSIQLYKAEKKAESATDYLGG